MIGTTPLEDKPSRRPNQFSSNNDEPVSPSAPYTTPKPFPKPKPGNQKPVESYEMATQQIPSVSSPRTQPSSTPKTTPRQDGRSGKGNNHTISPDPDTQTSYF